MLDNVSMFTETKTEMEDMLFSGHATMVLTKPGTLTKKLLEFHHTHLEMDLDSRSNQECQDTELSSILNTSEETNSDSEFKTTTLMMPDNGSSLIQELRPSELTTEEATLLPTKLVKVTESMLLLPSDHGRVRSTRESPGTMDQEETSETLDANALTFTEDRTDTIDMLSSGTATTASTKPGTLIKLPTDIQDNHLLMELDSKSNPK